jgi:hypothetical protein
MIDDPISRMRERVAKCRRLADQITDPEAIAILKAMAEEGEVDIARLTSEGLERSGEEHERSADRVRLSAEVRLRRSGEHGYQVSVFDLSPDGCKIEFVTRPAVGSTVWVKFPGLEAVEASVRWIDGHIGGLKFERSLHPAVFKRLAKTTQVSWRPRQSR